MTIPSIHVRVDDRLIHGQVVTVWVRSLGAKTIWVVSNRAADEPIEVILLKSSVPAHLSLEVFHDVEAVAAWDKHPQGNVLILTETIEAVNVLIQSGLPIEEVNLGGIRYAPHRIALSKAVYVGLSEVEALAELKSFDVPTYIRVLPSDSKVDVFERVAQRWTPSK